MLNQRAGDEKKINNGPGNSNIAKKKTKTKREKEEEIGLQNNITYIF